MSINLLMFGVAAENLEVTPSSTFQSPSSYFPPSCGFTSPFLSPTAPTLPSSDIQSLNPLENRENSDFFSKKMTMVLWVKIVLASLTSFWRWTRLLILTSWPRVLTHWCLKQIHLPTMLQLVRVFLRVPHRVSSKYKEFLLGKWQKCVMS